MKDNAETKIKACTVISNKYKCWLAVQWVLYHLMKPRTCWNSDGPGSHGRMKALFLWRTTIVLYDPPFSPCAHIFQNACLAKVVPALRPNSVTPTICSLILQTNAQRTLIYYSPREWMNYLCCCFSFSMMIDSFINSFDSHFIDLSSGTLPQLTSQLFTLCLPLSNNYKTLWNVTWLGHLLPSIFLGKKELPILISWVRLLWSLNKDRLVQKRQA